MEHKLEPNKISGLSSTLLITLWAKAVEYDKPDSLLRDAEAVRMKKMIDYDFQKFESARLSQVGCCGRAKLFDQEILRFIAQYPDAVVVQLGAGLDARFERLGRPHVSAWYDLDLPEVMAIRRQLLPEGQTQYLADSLFSTSWMETIAAQQKPVLLILEGVLMYFSEEKVKAFFANVAEKLPGATLIFDAVPPVAVGQAKHHDALKKMDNEERPEFAWTVKNAKTLETWHPAIKIITMHYLSDICRSHYPWYARALFATGWGKRYCDQRIIVMKLVK
ncbi:class I SAM-dependent methyltransferase [Pasteurella sp. PK-2025]|uniref:class I SAM-dependent methyltransferase n=1 Tax=unclassified Pasteurella TaxID=2621516 RepID=UPI003C73DEBD